jgi:hypothetical protein
MTDNKMRKVRSTHSSKLSPQSDQLSNITNTTSNVKTIDSNDYNNNNHLDITTTIDPSSTEINSDVIILDLDHAHKRINGIGEVILKWYSKRSVKHFQSITKAFYLWRYFIYSPSSVFGTSSSSSTSSDLNLNVTSSSSSSPTTTTLSSTTIPPLTTIAAATTTTSTSITSQENEQLKLELKQMKLKQLKLFLIIRYNNININKKRYYFDKWYYHNNIIYILSSFSKKSLELQVNIQYVNSKRNYIKFLEDTNIKLKLTLSLILYFYHWKASIMNISLQEERKLYEYQRKIIFNELIRIR